MDVYKTVKGWLLIVSGFPLHQRNTILHNVIETIEEFGLDGELQVHHKGEQKDDYYGGPYDTITLLLHSKQWITNSFVQRVKGYYLEREDAFARNEYK
jgi:hypothetical protein